MVRSLLFLSLAFTTFASTAFSQSALPLKPRVYQVQPTDDLQYRLQDILVKAIPGDVVEFSEGMFRLARQIDIASDNITLRGQGPDKTILSFRGQQSGGQGIESTGNNFLVEDLAVEDTSGNAIKVIGVRSVTFRNVRVEWTGTAQSTNGAYGLYPVQCSNVLIDSCVAIGASDSGIYVGQSRNVIVRNCRAERNVAGIEIENSVDADVYDNVATNNTGGILVFDLPGLQLKAGKNVRLFRNQVIANNHKNFAAPGNIVALVPPGTGVMVMATDLVEIFDNDIKRNQTGNISIISYLVSGKKIKDNSYDPYCKTVLIHDNRVSDGGNQPSGQISEILMPALGTPLPDIIFDGAVNPKHFVNGEIPRARRMSITNNGRATFANVKLGEFSPEKLRDGRYQPSLDVSPYDHTLPSLPAVALNAHDPPKLAMSKAVRAYRQAPTHLSEYGLFKGNGATQEPVDGVVPYTLNTTLFSDYATKYRFIRIPNGTSIDYVSSGVLKFPEGTVIAKTFAYPVDKSESATGQRLIETRIEALQDGEWYGYSYQWNEAQTEAKLLLGGGKVRVTRTDADGESVSHEYEIPNANQCLNCHSKEKSYVPIGPTARNMNRDFDFEDGKNNQLDYLAKKHWLKDLPVPGQRDRMPVSNEPATGSLDKRAHAWLHVNCAHCHNPFGTARTSGLDLRFSQSDPSKFGLWKSPTAAGHGSGGREYDIVPGEPDKSILLYRIESTDPSVRMPNVARNLVPREAASLLREWIAAMPKE